MTESTTYANGTNTANNTKTGTKPAKRTRNLPSLNSFGSASNMAKGLYKVLVSDTPIDFSNLKNYEIFSLNPDGSFPMMRISCSKAVSISDREVHPCGSGRCYRVSLSPHVEIESEKE